MRVSAIIEARMGSTRLPGKVMLQAGGLPLLAHMLRRISKASLIDTIVVATPTGKDNQPIWDLVKQAESVRLVKGDEADVMGRVLQAAQETKTDVIVELTADCPLIDPYAIDLCAGYYICGNWDFVGNVAPRTWPRGMDVRVFSRATLEAIRPLALAHPRRDYWVEHVSPYIYEESGLSCLNLPAAERIAYPELNLSVDTADDYRRVKDIIETLFPLNADVDTLGIVEYLASLPGYDMLHAPKPETIPAAWAIDAANLKESPWLRS